MVDVDFAFPELGAAVKWKIILLGSYRSGHQAFKEHLKRSRNCLSVAAERAAAAGCLPSSDPWRGAMTGCTAVRPDQAPAGAVMCSQAAGHRDAQPAVHAVALRRTPVTLDMRPTVSAKRRRWPAMITRRPVARALPHDRFAALADAGLVQARAGRRLVGPRGTRREDRGVAGPQRKAVAVGFVERLGDGRVLDIGDAAYAAQW